MISLSKFIIFVFGFLMLAQQLLSQSEKFKTNIKVYPSITTMYGLLAYKIEKGQKNQTGSTYYNQNYCVGININADLFVREDFALQFYAGYNRWNFANLFPIGLMLKPRINKKVNEAYFKIGGGYTFGRRYDDFNEKWRSNTMPKDYGKGKTHIQAGFEKNWHLSQSKSVSLAFMVNVQFIKSYYPTDGFYNQSAATNLSQYTIPYKFIGFTFAYHFY